MEGKPLMNGTPEELKKLLNAPAYEGERPAAQAAESAGPVYDTVPDKGVKSKVSAGRIAAVGVAAGVALSGGLIGLNAYQAGEAERALTERQIALEETRLAAEAESAEAVVSEADKAREKNVRDCIDAGKDGDQYGSQTAQIIERCAAAFPAPVPVNATSVASSPQSGSVDLNGTTVLVIAVGAAALWGSAKFRRRHIA
jgi:hypothetical protein